MSLRKKIEDTRHTPKALCKMARLLGYKDPFHQLTYDDGSVVGDLLEFLEDNPGACQAVIQWVLDEGRTSDGEELDDEEDEEGPDVGTDGDPGPTPDPKLPGFSRYE